ncbi:MAG: MerR family transcriptional regulator, copper efflux regulator [Solirubrobacteraceae bacterium]|jgi:hypothetical protein|nr:MerR family transcriptional regulator, copper efflux regulator [Solirubrobacteraceae bacterium]
MSYQQIRGSEKLMAALDARGIGAEAIEEIAEAIERSPATVDSAHVVGDDDRITGLKLSLSYADEDVPRCGNDIAFWRDWHRTHGKASLLDSYVLVNGVPPYYLTLDVHFGDAVRQPARGPIAAGQIGQIGG